MKQLEIQTETVDNVLNIVDDIKGKSVSSKANETIWTIGEDGWKAVETNIEKGLETTSKPVLDTESEKQERKVSGTGGRYKF